MWTKKSSRLTPHEPAIGGTRGKKKSRIPAKKSGNQTTTGSQESAKQKELNSGRKNHPYSCSNKKITGKEETMKK